MQLAQLANWPDTALCFAIEWRDVTPAWTWHDWQIRTAETQHELSNRAIRLTFAGKSLFYSGDGRPTAQSIALMAGADLAFQECASLTALSDDASHGDFPACLALFQTLALPAMGLYHCYDAILPALRIACRPWTGCSLARTAYNTIFISHRAAARKARHERTSPKTEHYRRGRCPPRRGLARGRFPRAEQ
nr:metal-dependent hydrolases of the beta-lactamase superfamily III [Raoultella sp. NCTC 9187]